MAIPLTRNLRRKHHAFSKRLRRSQSRLAVQRTELVLRPLRNNFRPEPGTRESAWRRYRDSTSHGVPRRILRGSLGQENGLAPPADSSDASAWHPRRRGPGPDAPRELKSMGFALLA